MPIETILFDLDGTLIDSAADLIALVNQTLALYGRPPVALADGTRFIGDGARKLIERAFAHTGPALDVAALDAVTQRFLLDYERLQHRPDQLYPHVADTLAMLKARGYRLGLCTNKPERPTWQLLRDVGLVDAFHGVSGGDSAPVRKPDPGHVLDALARAGGRVPHAIMVGDNELDIAAGRAAGLRTVLVGYGYPRVPRESIPADARIAHMAELPAAIRQLDRGMA